MFTCNYEFKGTRTHTHVHTHSDNLIYWRLKCHIKCITDRATRKHIGREVICRYMLGRIIPY